MTCYKRFIYKNLEMTIISSTTNEKFDMLHVNVVVTIDFNGSLDNYIYMKIFERFKIC